MTRPRAHMNLILGLAAIAGLGMLAQVAGAQSICEEWTVVSTPNPGSGNRGLSGLAALSADDIYALGSSGAGPFVIHWNGSGWNEITLPDLGDPYNLRAMGEVSGRVWVAGFGSSGPWTTFQVFMSWNGSEWDMAEVFDLIRQSDGSTRGGSPVDISGISDSDIWTVGDGNELLGSGGGSLLTLHWDGSETQEIITQSVGDRHNHLRGVAAIASDDAWAVGHYSDPLTNIMHALILRWDGSSWSRFDQPAEDLDMTFLKDVTAISADDIWVVGENNGEPLFMHFDGSDWTIVPGPPVPISLSVGKVAAVATDDVWAVTHSSVGFFHWDGSSWGVVAAPEVAGATGTAFGGALEAVGECDVWSVGGWSDGSWNFTLAAHVGPSGAPTGIGGDSPSLTTLRLRQNFPNPFSGATRIEFDLPYASDVVVEVYDVTGKRVHIDHHPVLPAGPNTIELSARRFRAGVYCYRVSAGELSQSKKLVVVR